MTWTRNIRLSRRAFALVLTALHPLPRALSCSLLAEHRANDPPRLVDTLPAWQGAAVTYSLQRYTVSAKPEAIIDTVARADRSVAVPGDLAAAMQTRLPLFADIDVREIVASFAAAVPAADARRLRHKAEQELQYTFADLMERGEVAVRDGARDAWLPSLSVHRYIDGCYGGKRFLSPDGETILTIETAVP